VENTRTDEKSGNLREFYKTGPRTADPSTAWGNIIPTERIKINALNGTSDLSFVEERRLRKILHGCSVFGLSPAKLCIKQHRELVTLRASLYSQWRPA
jgi:hypothetical protein